MTCALGDEQRAQRFGIGRQIIGDHTIRCIALALHRQRLGMGQASM
jgi:hypothetical protein